MSTPKEPRQTNEPPKHRSTGKVLTYAMTVLLLVIVVIAFVGTPALSGVAGGSRISFGSYAGRDIVYEPGNYLGRQYQDLARRVQDQDQEVTEGLVRQIWQAAFQRTVFHEAMMVLAEDAGVAISTSGIDRAIAQWPEFQVNGRFSAEEYNSTSSQVRLALREYLREALVGSQVQADLFGETPVSNAEQAFLLEMAGPERRFDFVQFSFNDYPESEVRDYGQQNADRFRRTNLSVITINSSEADAQSIRDRAISRETSFEDLARNQSRDSYSNDGGEMGWVYYHELEPDFENPAVIDQIFALDEGEISEVLQTTFGWTIYRVNEAPVAPDFTDADVLSAVRDYMTVFERGIIEDYLSERASDFAAEARSAGFDAAAATVDQAPGQTSYFPVNYGNTPYYGTVGAQSNQTLAAAAFRDEFFRQLFSLEQDDVSEPIVVRDFVFVFRLDDERQPSDETLDFLESYVPLIVREFTQQQVQETFIDDDKLVDNFASTYNRVILGR